VLPRDTQHNDGVFQDRVVLCAEKQAGAGGTQLHEGQASRRRRGNPRYAVRILVSLRRNMLTQSGKMGDLWGF
jgi:hypothetical protein